MIEELITQLVEKARSAYGETTFKYTKIWNQWRPGRKRGQQGQYWTNCGDDLVITKEEYKAGVEEGRIASHKAFFRKGDKDQASYWSYRRKIDSGGWLHVLTDALSRRADQIEDTTAAPDRGE